MNARNFIIIRLHHIALAVLLAGPAAHAADGTWIVGDGTWITASDWASSIIADGTDSTASFTSELTANSTVTLGANRTIGNITFTDPTSSHNLSISGNTLTMDRTSGVPSIDVTQAFRELTISSIIAGNDGLEKNGPGTLRLNAANTFTNGLTIKAGTVFVNPATGVNPLSSGNVTIGDVANTGASAELLYIGTNGNNSFNNSINVRGNGTATIRVLGFNPTFSGAVNLANNLTVVSNNNFGSTIGMSGGVTGTGNLVIQSNAANGTNNSAITLSGTSINMTGSITNSGTTTSTTASNTTISAVIGTNVTGITQNSANSQLILTGANTFTGNITVSAGTLNANLGQGGNNPTSGALGNPSTPGRQVTVASGATLNFNNPDVLGQGGTSNTALTLIANGGTIRNNVNGINTVGPVQLNGGTLTSIATGTAGFRLTGTVTVGGSAVSTMSASTGTGTITSAGVITYDVANAVVGSDLNVTAVVANSFSSGGINKTGNGTMTLSNTNAYTNTTTISAGTLAVTGSGSINTSSGITLNGGSLNYNSSVALTAPLTFTSGTLSGNGTINQNLTVNGSIAPGNSIGVLNVGGNVTWNPGGSPWVFELEPGNTADLLNITGNFTKSSNGIFSFDFAGSTATGNFTLVDWGNSQVTNFNAGDFSYSNLGGGNTGTFQISGTTLQFIAVPEPGTIALVASGMALLGLHRVRRRRG